MIEKTPFLFLNHKQSKTVCMLVCIKFNDSKLATNQDLFLDTKYTMGSPCLKNKSINL